MSDTDTTTRLSRARAAMHQAHACLTTALRVDVAPAATWKLIARATAEHSCALRELFLATLEANAEPPKRHVYNADGPAYRRLRREMSAGSQAHAVAAIDRLEQFAADEADVRLVAGLLVEVLGEHETAASLLRNVEG